MHILLTGGTGFIGQPLCQQLLEDGHKLTVLTRQSRAGNDRCRYICQLQEIDSSCTIDAVINLAGAPLDQQRWTAAYKRQLLTSRLQITGDLVQLLHRLETKPEVLLSASAIGYYGHHGDEKLEETAAVSPGFAQDLCQQWEQLAATAGELGVRVCLLRLGVVLENDGGAFNQMARSFSFGLATWLGTGNQWLSWIHRTDVIHAVQFLLQRKDLTGPFNVTAPHPVTSRGFCDAMRRHKRTLPGVPVPAAVLRIMVGEMAEELLLNGQRVIPARLQRAGFDFAFEDLDSALTAIT